MTRRTTGIGQRHRAVAEVAAVVGGEGVVAAGGGVAGAAGAGAAGASAGAGAAGLARRECVQRDRGRRRSAHPPRSLARLLGRRTTVVVVVAAAPLALLLCSPPSVLTSA
jgi:hypothetical protein